MGNFENWMNCTGIRFFFQSLYHSKRSSDTESFTFWAKYRLNSSCYSFYLFLLQQIINIYKKHSKRSNISGTLHLLERKKKLLANVISDTDKTLMRQSKQLQYVSRLSMKQSPQSLPTWSNRYQWASVEKLLLWQLLETDQSWQQFLHRCCSFKSTPKGTVYHLIFHN